MVSLGGLAETRGVVRVAQPAGAEQAGLEALLEWLEREQDGLAEALAVHGALLLRGFAVDGAADFARVAQQAARLFPDPRPDATEAGPLRSYAGGDSPRTNVLQGVYTSTDAPASSDIALHNEMSFDPRWPSKVMFYCEQAPGSGGETPLADSRAVLAALPADLRRRFERHGVRYTRNLYGNYIGSSWQQSFETEDRDVAEAICRSANARFEWRRLSARQLILRDQITRPMRAIGMQFSETGDDYLRLSQTGPACMTHPRTGEPAWFNQAHLWHVSGSSERVQAALRQYHDEDELPQNAYFGDGSQIPESDLRQVRAAYADCEVRFAWQRGDVLLLDNVLMAHGRRRFSGARRVLAALL